MKRNLVFLIAAGLMIGRLAVCAQDNPPVSETPNAAPAADVTAPAETATTADSTAAVEVNVENEPVSSISPASDHDAAPSATMSAIIPLIVMDEVPLTDAIKNLARQANINYMLDPRLVFGQPGADGRPVPQPNVSIRWENISAEQALNALLNNYTLQMVEDPKTRIARITLKDPAAPDPLLTKIIQLKYASPSNLITSVQSGFVDRRSKVIADVRTSQIVVVATEKELRAIDEMVLRLDLPTRQVLIEARLLETSMNPKTVKGLDWTGTLQAQKLSFGNNLQSQPQDSGQSDNKPLASAWPKMMFDTARGFNPGTAFLDADGVSAVFAFLNKNAEAKVISAPRTVTLDNETAKIDVVRQIPIITTSPSSANTPGASSITYSNVGVILNVTPRISADDTVNLKVTPEVSRVFSIDEVQSGGAQNTVYTFDKRVLTTTVVIPSGNTLVLGGLVQDDIRTGNTKVPGLGDIPFLGRAFRTDSKERSQNNLLIFITPTIVQDSDYQPTQTTFLRNPVPKEDSKEWSSWDSGKPKDWSRRNKSDAKFQDFSSAN
ncbi:MAG TPA: secretin N-terminal domain-containing protein [Verrucomicrobiae bacterium]|nr:secretin N-terminal domain-containing protein [Verrucomicrobiae bacterium]